MQPRNRDTTQLERARELRQDANLPERILWEQLRGRRFQGFKFRRQHPIGPYVVDFYCAAASVVLELDGETHRNKADYDTRRNQKLEECGLLVVRCPNVELYENLDGLMEKVWQVCCERSKESGVRAGTTARPSPPAPLPRGARGERKEQA